MLSKAVIDYSTAPKTIEIIGLVVLSTQKHEEMRWTFPIAGNGAFCSSL